VGELETQRREMVKEQVAARGVSDPRVLQAMLAVPRDVFVPHALVDRAYHDGPLPIGSGQTISQPYVVGVMTARAAVGPGQRVLEIGTGCGYQTAILCEVGAEVFSIERVPALAAAAAETLASLGYRAHLRIGDGYAGWPDAAPFDAIVVTAAPPEVPPALLAQLADGGRLVIPVGSTQQDLRVYHRRGDQAILERVFPVQFVPMLAG